MCFRTLLQSANYIRDSAGGRESCKFSRSRLSVLVFLSSPGRIFQRRHQSPSNCNCSFYCLQRCNAISHIQSGSFVFLAADGRGRRSHFLPVFLSFFNASFNPYHNCCHPSGEEPLFADYVAHRLSLCLSTHSGRRPGSRWASLITADNST